MRFDVHGTVSPYTVFGVGLRGEGAIVPDGFFGGDVHDELALSLGGDAYFYELNPDWYSGGVYLVPIAALQWNFYVGQHWSIFPEAGLAFHVQPDNNGWNGRNAVYAEPDLALGVRYHFSHRNALMVRGGVPGGLQIGLTF